MGGVRAGDGESEHAGVRGDAGSGRLAEGRRAGVGQWVSAGGVSGNAVARRRIADFEFEDAVGNQRQSAARDAGFDQPIEPRIAAKQRAESAALEQALASGAKDPTITISVERSFLPDASSDDGLLTAKVTAEARGRP